MSILDAGSPQPQNTDSPNILSVGAPATEAATARIQNSTGANPDNAAQSIQIGNDLGIPAQIINNDFENFKNLHENQAAADVVKNNPHLTDYVASNPMAALVSKDDWLPLDAATKAAKAVGGQSFVGATVEGFLKGLDYGSIDSWTGIDYRDPEVRADHPALSAIAYGLTRVSHPVEFAAKLFSGITTALGYGAAHAVGTVAGAGAEGDVRSMADALQDPGFWASIGPLGEMVGLPFEQAAMNRSLRSEALRLAPYIQDGKVPPVGTDPIIDSVHAEQAAHDKDALNEALKASQASMTRERSPDMYAGLMREVTSGTIGVKADAVRALYGDKVPETDDGLLGWVPDIHAQLSAAEASGGDIQIPLSEYLTRVEPDVAKQLEDYVRVRPEGMTVEEADEFKPQEAVDKTLQPTVEGQESVEQPPLDRGTEAVNAVRQQASFDPKDSIIQKAVEADPSKPFEGAAPGITKTQTDRYLKLIEQRQADDAERASARVLRDQRLRQSAEWNANRTVMRDGVSKDTYGSPSVKLFEHLAEGRLQLNSEALTQAQRDALPKNWKSSHGLLPSDAAAMFQHPDGARLVNEVQNLEDGRKTAGDIPHQAFIERMIDGETDRRMEVEHGNLEKNIINEAKDQVLSEIQENMLHEQTLRLAEEAGLQYPIKKAEIKSAVSDTFSKLPARTISSDRLLADAGRAGRAMEDAHLKKDVAEAFRQSQRQQLAFMLAKEARGYEKEQAQFEKFAKKYSKREVKGVLPEYTNAIHSIFQKIGLPIGRLPADLARELAAGDYSSLGDFVSKKESDFAVSQLELPVADFIINDGTPKIGDMNVWEARGLHQSVKTLDFFGRMENKVIRSGETFDRKEVVKDMVKQLSDSFEPREMSLKKSGLVKPFTKQVIAVMHSLETVFFRWDRRDEDGVFTRMFTYPAAEAMNNQARIERGISRTYRELPSLKNPKQAVDHSFIDSMTGKRFAGFTRNNLDAIIANIGNKYNAERMAWTLGLKDAEGKPDVGRLMDWVERNSTKEDVERAQGRGDIFSDLKKQSDTVYRGIYGVAPEDIPLTPFEMHGKTWDGWYHPIIQDPERKIRDHAAVKDTITKPTSFWPSTPNGYTKRRSGAFERLSLDNSMIPVHLNQVIHDVSAHDFVYQTAKLINDGELRSGVTKYYGKEYHDLMKRWLYVIAGNASFNDSAIQSGAKFSNELRQNVISTYIAFNPGTVMKHAPTAAVMSAKELGGIVKGIPKLAGVSARAFADSVSTLFGRDPALGETMTEFATRNSEELQRRERNYQDTLGGAHNILYGAPTVRNKVMQTGAWLVAKSDLASAVPLWLAKYNDEMTKHGIHGDAVKRADFAIRRAHGSTSLASAPVIATEGGALAPWFTSFYGVFGANMQRKIELMHDISDTYKLAKDGEIAAAAKGLPQVMSSVMTQVIWPAVVEEAVTGQFTDDRRGFLAKSLDFILQATTNSIIGIRDVSWAFEHGEDPSAGLLSAPLNDARNALRDALNHPLSRQHAGRFLQDSLTVLGDLTGLSPKPIARAARYGTDVALGVQQPHNLADVYRGLSSGQQRPRIER
jgi:hypothetical protein